MSFLDISHILLTSCKAGEGVSRRSTVRTPPGEEEVYISHSCTSLLLTLTMEEVQVSCRLSAWPTPAAPPTPFSLAHKRHTVSAMSGAQSMHLLGRLNERGLIGRHSSECV